MPERSVVEKYLKNADVKLAQQTVAGIPQLVADLAKQGDALAKAEERLEHAVSQYGAFSRQARSAASAVSLFSEAFKGHADALKTAASAYDVLEKHSLSTFAAITKGVESFQSFSRGIHNVHEGISRLVREQAAANIGFKSLADNISLSGSASTDAEDRLRKFAKALNRTREEALALRPAFEAAAAQGIGPDKVNEIAAKLRALRGNAEGDRLASQAFTSGLTEADIGVAQGGDNRAVAERMRVLSAEQRSVFQEIARSRNAQPGPDQRFQNSEAQNKAKWDQYGAQAGQAAMGTVTAVNESGAPVLLKGLDALVHIGGEGNKFLAMIARNTGLGTLGSVGGALGSGGGGGLGGKLLGSLGIGLRGARFLRGGLVGAAGEVLGAGADYLADQAAPGSTGRTAGRIGGAAARIGGYALAGGLVGGGIPGAVVGGLLGTALEAYRQFGAKEKRNPQNLAGQSVDAQGRPIVAAAAAAGPDVFNDDLALRQADTFRGTTASRFAGARDQITAEQAAAAFAESRMSTAVAGGSPEDIEELTRARVLGLAREKRAINAAVADQQERIDQEKKDIEVRLAAKAIDAQAASTLRDLNRAKQADLDLNKQAFKNRGFDAFAAAADTLRDATENSAGFRGSRARSGRLGASLEAEEAGGLSPERARQLGAGLANEAAVRHAQLQSEEAAAIAAIHDRANNQATLAGGDDGEVRRIRAKELVEVEARLAQTEHARAEVLQASVSAVTRAAEAERRRLSVQSALAETAFDLAQHIGLSYQEQFRIQTDLLRIKQQEAEVTRREIEELRKKPDFNAQDQKEIQEKTKQLAQQSAEIIKTALGAQKSVLSKALGEMFGSPRSSKFQPSFGNRLLYGEHSLVNGLPVRGQVSHQEQRQALFDQLLKQARGGLPAGKPGGPPGAPVGVPAVGGAPGGAPGGAGGVPAAGGAAGGPGVGGAKPVEGKVEVTLMLDPKSPVFVQGARAIAQAEIIKFARDKLVFRVPGG